MKSLLAFLIFSVVVCEIIADKLHITIFYSTLSPASKKFFKRQFAMTFQDSAIRRITKVELVPFGKANFTENPFKITCENGPDECAGNVMNACFINLQPQSHRYIEFVSCCMSDAFPPHAGERCARKLGYSFKGVMECTGNTEGNNLQIENGKRTKNFKPEITSLPTIVYDNVYNAKDNEDSINHFMRVIKRKLKAKGVRL